MPLLFAVTLFVSAFLLFLVQPMVGKMVLPLLGGTPAVWNTCMVFFQAALLAGYAYTHTVSTRLPVRRQLLLQGAILVLPFLFLPFKIGSWQPPTESNPTFAVLGLLTLMVGIPFFVVATSAPLLQKWFAATGHPTARDPYFLYGASNLGSMLALLAYPLLFEPRFPVATQSWLWAAAYIAFIALTLACAATVWFAPPVVAMPSNPPADDPVPAPAPEPTPAAVGSSITRTGWRTRRGSSALATVVAASAPAKPVDTSAEVTWLRRLRWIGLAAVPSSLMLGVTTYLTTDIAAIPLFWVVPLALYLLSFILVFMRWPVEWSRGPHTAVLVLQPLSLVVLIVFSLSDSYLAPRSQSLSFAVNLLAFFLTALLCHGELARDRPATRYLTEFYLCMSLGGVLGGMLNGLVAPLVFNRLVEYMLVLALSCLLRPPLGLLAALRGGRTKAAGQSTREDFILDVGYAICVGLLTYAMIRIAVAQNIWGKDNNLRHEIATHLYERGTPGNRAMATGEWVSTILIVGIPLGACLLFASRPLRFGLCAFAFFLANGVYKTATDESLYIHRSFFGVIRVEAEQDEHGKRHALFHGGIDHGSQYIEGPWRYEPITYFHPTGPVGQVFTRFRKQKEKPPYAVVGLGIGSLAAYGLRDQVVHFYEIDPAVKNLSLPPEGEKPYFFYLQDARERGVKLDVILGDGRLRMKEAREHQYQIIVLDAFSSDAIPVHLLTLEAVDLYLSKLAEGGVLVFNITNRYVDLKQPLANIAAKKGMLCYYGTGNDESAAANTPEWSAPDKYSTDWVVLVKPPSRATLAAETNERVRSQAVRLLGTNPAANGFAAVPWGGLVAELPSDVPRWLRGFDSNDCWEILQPNNDPVWTDDYSNLLSVLNL